MLKRQVSRFKNMSCLRFAAILAFLREASLDLSSSLPLYPLSQGSWSPTESGFINTRTTPNSTRRSAPWFRLNWRLSHNVSRRWRSGSSTTGFNWTQPSPRPWSSVQGRAFPSWSPSPRWTSAMVMWRSRTKSKSSVFTSIQPCQWTPKWSRW